MPRRYRINFGRKTVKPFKEHDINNMLVICKKRRNQAEEDSNKEQQYLWDRNYMILVIGMNLAFRIEDIIQLKVDYFKNGGIYIREFKTNKEQSFELHPSLYKDIINYINRNNLIDGEYLFKSRKGMNKPLTRQRAWQIIKELADEVKVSYPVGCHSLRKYFARRYYEETGDIIGLKEMLNHSSERVTLIYICWDDNDKNDKRKSFYLGSQLNPVHDNFELRKAMLGRRNCVIYTVGTFEIAEENLYTLKISNIKLVGLAFAKMKFKPRKKERQKPLNIVLDEIHELPLNVTIGIDISEQKDRYISGDMH